MLPSSKIIPMECGIQRSAPNLQLRQEKFQATLDAAGKEDAPGLKPHQVRFQKVVVLEQLMRKPIDHAIEQFRGD
jgi:hypothetical protein